MKEDARNHSDSLCIQEEPKAFELREITWHGGAEPPHIFAAGVSADIANLVAESRASSKANQVGRSWVRHFINGLELVEPSKREIKAGINGLAQPPRYQKYDYAKLNGTQASASIGPPGRGRWVQVGSVFDHLCKQCQTGGKG